MCLVVVVYFQRGLYNLYGLQTPVQLILKCHNVSWDHYAGQ